MWPYKNLHCTVLSKNTIKLKTLITYQIWWRKHPKKTPLTIGVHQQIIKRRFQLQVRIRARRRIRHAIADGIRYSSVDNNSLWMMIIMVIRIIIGFHVPRHVGVPPGELLHQSPESRGAGLHLHRAWYVHDLNSLSPPFSLSRVLHVLNTSG